MLGWLQLLSIQFYDGYWCWVGPIICQSILEILQNIVFGMLKKNRHNKRKMCRKLYCLYLYLFLAYLKRFANWAKNWELYKAVVVLEESIIIIILNISNYKPY